MIDLRVTEERRTAELADRAHDFTELEADLLHDRELLLREVERRTRERDEQRQGRRTVEREWREIKAELERLRKAGLRILRHARHVMGRTELEGEEYSGWSVADYCEQVLVPLLDPTFRRDAALHPEEKR